MNFKLFFVLFYVSFCYSQHNNDIAISSKKSLALYYGYGFKTGLLSKINYYYKPNIYLLEYKKKLIEKKITTLSLRFSAEYNNVDFCESYISNPCIEYKNNDYGLNFSFDVSTKITERLTIYTFIGTGPHYLETRLGRQAKGLIFSDVFAIGLDHKFYKNKYFIDIRYSLRHLSNAGIARPNVAIENNIIYAGIGKNL
jgi:hypothetical protein